MNLKNNGVRRRLAKRGREREQLNARLDRGWSPRERGSGRRLDKRQANRDYAKAKRERT